MTRSTTKKTAAKKTAAKGSASSADTDPLAAVRDDTPNPELTDLDREGDVCTYCGRDAVSTISFGRKVCEKHAARRSDAEEYA